MTDTAQAPAPEEGNDEQLTMGMDPWEKNWLRASILLLAAFFVLVTIAGFAAGFQLPGPEAEVDPRTVAQEGPFASPGVTEISEGEFEAYILAQTFSFAPAEIVLPVGANVDLYVTSPDVQHGFKITDTNVNMQIVPGQVSKLRFEFDEVGEYPIICTEYCGSGHAAMAGVVKVVSEAEYAGGDDAADDSDATEEDG